MRIFGGRAPKRIVRAMLAMATAGVIPVFCAAAPSTNSTAEGMCSERVPLAQLIARPEAHDGKAVWVVGTVSFGLERMAICPHGDETGIRNCLWLDIYEHPHDSEHHPINDLRLQEWSRFNLQTVAVHGTFKSTPESRGYPGELHRILEVSGRHEAIGFGGIRALPRNPCGGKLPEETSAQKVLRGDYDGAIVQLDRAIERDPRNFSSYLQRAHAKGMKQDYAGAMDDYSLAIEVGGSVETTSIALLYRAAMKARAGDLRGAIVDYTGAIELDPDIPRAHRERGLLRQKIGDFEGAKADFARGGQPQPGQ